MPRGWDDPTGSNDASGEFEPGVPLEREPPLGPTWAGAVAAALAVTVSAHLALGLGIVLVLQAFAAVGVQSIVVGGLWGRTGIGALVATGLLFGPMLWMAHRSPWLGLIVFAVGVLSVVVLTVLILRRMPLEPRSGEARQRAES